ncbi:MAG TPA: hypothetical protein VMH34_07580 [Gammaproteobacteria bacterium]|nr:hypothetical protein [Gammaproteobacteria bacterium]
MDDESGGLTLATFASSLLNTLVRLTGLALLGIGTWTAVNLIEEVWALYHDPARPTVEHFATAIENASHVDRLLTPKHGIGAEDTAAPDATGASPDARSAVPAAAPATKTEETFRFSYFIAWPIVLLMLLLIGRLALAMIKIGGELALYDVQIRRFAAGLLREVARNR